MFSSLFQGGSQEDLDRRSSIPRMKSYDAVVFDVLRVSPEDFAVRFIYTIVLYSMVIVNITIPNIDFKWKKVLHHLISVIPVPFNIKLT